MAIKIDPLYGDESTWLNVNGYGKLATLTQQYDKKYFNHTIGAGLANGTLEEINKSVCPIAVDSGSTLGNGHYVTLNTDGTLYDYVVEPSAQTALMYASSMRGQSTNTYYNQYADTNTTKQNSSWNSGVTTNDYVANFPAVATSMTQPIVEFPYKNYVLIIIVFASKDDTAPESNSVRCDLATYLSKYATSYPYVNCVEVSPMRWSSEYQYPDFIKSNIQVSSDTSVINRTDNQTYFNFSAIGIGNVNKMVDRDGNEHLFYTSNNNPWGTAKVFFWDGDEYRNIEFNGRQVIFGFGESFADELYQNYTRAIYIPDVDGMIQIKQREAKRPDRIYTYYHVTDVKAFEEFCLKQTAYFGMYFSTSLLDMNSLTPDTLSTKETTYLGLIDENGVTHGEYVKGKEIKKHPQSEWDSLKNQSPYDYTKKPVAPDKERDSVDYRTQNLYIGLETGNYYALTAKEIKQLLSWCNKVVAPEGKFKVENPAEGEYTYQELADQLRQLFNGAYPNDQIISLMYFPFDIENSLNTAIKTEGQIQLANTSTKALTGWFGSDIPEVTATKIAGGTQFAVFETKPYAIEQYYGDFRDYAPYTAMSVTVPYHGSVPINAGDWYGHSLKIRVNADIITGSSVAFIYRDNAVVATISGQIGVPIQLVIRNVGDFTNSIIDGNQLALQQNTNTTKNLAGLLSSVVAGTAGGATGNVAMIGAGVAGAFSSFAGATTSQKLYKNTSTTLDHTQASNTLVSVVSPSTSMCQDIRPMLQIVYPRLMTGYSSSIYGKTVGFACEIQGAINTFTGFSVFSGANLDGINAPDVEKTMIYQKLKDGIII